MSSAPRSVYEYMGNKKWLQSARQEEAGQLQIEGCEQRRLPLDLDERYTTRETIAWCMEKAGVAAFDLDVAACEESHKAPAWFSITNDGLSMPWFGRAWCNPPYSDIEPWVVKAHFMITSGAAAVIAQLLPATRTEQPWWQKWVEPNRDRGSFLKSHFLPGRTRFGIPGNPEGVGVGSPPFGCVLLVWKNLKENE